jgi:pteridine reductase
VRVNGVAPGAILWPEGGQHFSPSERNRITEQTPLERIGTPERCRERGKNIYSSTPLS